MDTFDSQGNVLSIGAAEHGIVSKKIADKSGQGQGNRYQQQKKAVLDQPLKEDDTIQTEKIHAVDIIV